MHSIWTVSLLHICSWPALSPSLCLSLSLFFFFTNLQLKEMLKKQTIRNIQRTSSYLSSTDEQDCLDLTGRLNNECCCQRIWRERTSNDLLLWRECFEALWCFCLNLLSAHLKKKKEMQSRKRAMKINLTALSSSQGTGRTCCLLSHHHSYFDDMRRSCRLHQCI